MKLDEEILTVLRVRGPATDLSEMRAGRDWHAIHELLDLMHGPPAPPGRGVTVDRYNVPAEDGVPLPLRIYRKAGLYPRAVLLYVHGAGLLDRELDDCDTMCRRYALGADVAVAAVGYRPAPAGAEVGPVEDCHAALAWLAEYAADLGFDPARIGIAGDSAGGALAAGTALLARDAGGPELALQMLVYPMLDDRGTAPCASRGLGTQWTHELNDLAWRLILGGADREREATPYQVPARAKDLSGLPRTYLEVGELDIVRDQTLDFAERLTAAHVPVELHVRPGAAHGFDLCAPRSDLVREAIADRLRAMSAL
ncbi:alpha/beta hydrolase [Actinocorallia longicatena]|uniref:Alpha/beta hydrolase n=1 Tax=Actinocorallia longicatena TaxID=111803 RepID=A0ABP6QB65_9ACTN